MLKKINQLLKLIGFNLVHAKKPKARKPYTVKELLASKVTGVNCIPSPTCCVEKYNDGQTHYVGDSCPGGHRDTFKHVDASPTQDNNITGPTS